MIQQYHEDDGMDPGLGDLAFDGTEYELDEFGERIGTDDSMDDLFDDESPADISATQNDMARATQVEQGFGETIATDSNPHLGDQLDDPKLAEEAAADYVEPIEKTED